MLPESNSDIDTALEKANICQKIEDQDNKLFCYRKIVNENSFAQLRMGTYSVEKKEYKKAIKSEYKSALQFELFNFRSRFIWLSTALVFLFSFLIYSNTINHDYALDDTGAIQQNLNVHKGLKGIPDIFVRSSLFLYDLCKTTPKSQQRLTIIKCKC